MPTTYTVIEVAAILKLGTAVIYRLAHNGDLPYVRLGGQLRFTAAALRERLGLRPTEPIVVPEEKL